jgi:NAD(P)-dependent dehydrogenase (short-subunit alcohol dehydrogenase family)
MTSIGELIDLRGRRALLTGAAGHLGRVMAETLAELGAGLVLVDRPGSALEALAQDLRARWPVAVHCEACNLEQEAERNALIARVTADPLAILVNNAAFVGTSDLAGWSVPFEAQGLEAWRRALEVNLTAVFHLSQGLMPTLRRTPGASIVNIASIYGTLGPDWRLYADTSMANPAAYGASKGGLIQLTRWLATTVAPDVRVNAIAPGGIFRDQPEAFVQRYAERTPLRRMAREDDFRGALAYLASDLSSYVTGQVLAVDGGWSAW